MEQRDRSAVLYAVAYGPTVGLKVTVSYLRMKRAARKAEKRFFHELVRSGLPEGEARSLAGEYGSAISVREIISQLGNSIPILDRHP